jgi:hypothetical protein
MNSAEIILNQLGGGRFIAMTGAKMFTCSVDTLNFRLPANFANKGINHVSIKIDASDTYSVRFGKVRGLNFSVIAEHDNVYAENLCSTFTSVTGLDTRI